MTGDIPAKYRNSAFSELYEELQSALTEVVDTWMDGTPTGVLLSGPNGVGKTYAACALANEIWKGDLIYRPAVFVPAAMMRELGREQDEFREQSWERTLCKHPLLVIDDLGKENRATEYREAAEVQYIGKVLRFRIQNQRPTILTTNIEADDLSKVYGASIYSLLHEIGPWIDMTGPDRRKAQ